MARSQDIVKKGEDQSCGDDSQIVGCQRGDLLRCLCQADEKSASRHGQHSNNDSEDQTGHDGGGHLLFQSRKVTGPEVLCHDDRCAHGKAYDQKNQNIHNRTGRADGCQRLFSVKLPHHDGIHGVVELLEQVSEYQRNRIYKQVAGDTSLRHVSGNRLSSFCCPDK